MAAILCRPQCVSWYSPGTIWRWNFRGLVYEHFLMTSSEFWLELIRDVVLWLLSLYILQTMSCQLVIMQSFTTGGSGVCHKDNLWCHQRQQSCHDHNYCVSVNQRLWDLGKLNVIMIWLLLVAETTKLPWSQLSCVSESMPVGPRKVERYHDLASVGGRSSPNPMLIDTNHIYATGLGLQRIRFFSCESRIRVAKEEMLMV